jgi:hypothetical protein
MTYSIKDTTRGNGGGDGTFGVSAFSAVGPAEVSNVLTRSAQLARSYIWDAHHADLYIRPV